MASKRERLRKLYHASVEAARLKQEATLPPPPDVVQSVETAQSQTVVSTSDQERIQREREQQVTDQQKSLEALKADLDKRASTLTEQEAQKRAADDAPYPPRREKRRYSDAPDEGPEPVPNDAATADASADVASPGGEGSSSLLPLLAAVGAYVLFGRG